MTLHVAAPALLLLLSPVRDGGVEVDAADVTPPPPSPLPLVSPVRDGGVEVDAADVTPLPPSPLPLVSPVCDGGVEVDAADIPHVVHKVSEVHLEGDNMLLGGWTHRPN